MSTCAAEYVALSIATQTLANINFILDDIAPSISYEILCDNQAAIRVSTDDSANKRVRHVEREYYLTNQALHEKKTELIWVPTKQQLADILTKALTRDPFKCFRGKIMSGG